MTKHISKFEWDGGLDGLLSISAFSCTQKFTSIQQYSITECILYSKQCGDENKHCFTLSAYSPIRERHVKS